MSRSDSVVGSPSVNRSWTVIDFVLIWLGGLFGSALLATPGVLADNSDLTIILALAGQYLGNLAVFLLLRRRKEEREVGFRIEAGDFFYVGLGLIFQIAMALLILPLANLLFPDGRPPQEIAETIAEADSLLLQTSLVLVAVVIGPIAEEVLFRGVLLKAFERRGEIFAVVATAFIFSAVHILGLGTEDIWKSALVVLPPLFILGLVLARLTQRRGRLGPAIFLHSGWNLLAAFVLLLPSDLV